MSTGGNMGKDTDFLASSMQDPPDSEANYTCAAGSPSAGTAANFSPEESIMAGETQEGDYMAQVFEGLEWAESGLLDQAVM